MSDHDHDSQPADDDIDSQSESKWNLMFDVAGTLVASAWIAVVAYGLNQNWHHKLPALALVVVLVGSVIAVHYLAHQFGSHARHFVIFLHSQSSNSIPRFVIYLSVCGFLGGMAGWIMSDGLGGPIVRSICVALGVVWAIAVATILAQQERKSRNKKEESDE